MSFAVPYKTASFRKEEMITKEYNQKEYQKLRNNNFGKVKEKVKSTNVVPEYTNTMPMFFDIKKELSKITHEVPNQRIQKSNIINVTLNRSSKKNSESFTSNKQHKQN